MVLSLGQGHSDVLGEEQAGGWEVTDGCRQADGKSGFFSSGMETRLLRSFFCRFEEYVDLYLHSLIHTVLLVLN
jgi:hypothetical protein